MLTEIFVRVGRIQFLILGLVASGLVIFGKPFILLWAGKEYGEAYYVALLLTIPSSVALIQNVGIEIQRAMNLHKYRAYVYLIMALLNFVMSIYLVQIYGAIGAAIGTAISLVIANGLIMNLYYHQKCSLNIILFWKNILRQSCGLIPPLILGCILCCFTNLYAADTLIRCILGYTMFYCICVYHISMNTYERLLIKNIIRKLLKLEIKKEDRE